MTYPGKQWSVSAKDLRTTKESRVPFVGYPNDGLNPGFPFSIFLSASLSLLLYLVAGQNERSLAYAGFSLRFHLSRAMGTMF